MPKADIEVLSFRIRGRWSADDMAVLLHDCSSLYALRLALSTDVRFLSYPYRYRPWSPDTWYEWLGELSGAPLEVRRIEYASPGFIELSGLGDVIEQLRIFVENVIINAKQTKRRATIENDIHKEQLRAERLENARRFLRLTREARRLDIDESVVMDYFVQQVDGAQERMLRQIERQSLTSVKVVDRKRRKGTASG